jgi:hypothetical protein
MRKPKALYEMLLNVLKIVKTHTHTNTRTYVGTMKGAILFLYQKQLTPK